MVGVGGGEVAWRITGIQKSKKEKAKILPVDGADHRGEDSTKTGYKKTKNEQKILACGKGLTVAKSRRET